MIAANWWGKTKTIVQVATIFLLIAFDTSPLWLDLLTYVDGRDHRRQRASTTSSGCAGCCAKPRTAASAR